MCEVSSPSSPSSPSTEAELGEAQTAEAPPLESLESEDVEIEPEPLSTEDITGFEDLDGSAPTLLAKPPAELLAASRSSIEPAAPISEIPTQPAPYPLGARKTPPPSPPSSSHALPMARRRGGWKPANVMDTPLPTTPRSSPTPTPRSSSSPELTRRSSLPPAAAPSAERASVPSSIYVSPLSAAGASPLEARRGRLLDRPYLVIAAAFTVIFIAIAIASMWHAFRPPVRTVRAAAAFAAAPIPVLAQKLVAGEDAATAHRAIPTRAATR